MFNISYVGLFIIISYIKELNQRWISSLIQRLNIHFQLQKAFQSNPDRNGQYVNYSTVYATIRNAGLIKALNKSPILRCSSWE